MIIHRKDLINIKDYKSYEFNIDAINIENNIFIKSIKNCNAYFEFFYEADKLMLYTEIQCVMICPDLNDLSDVESPIEIKEEYEIIDNKIEDGIFIDRSIDIKELIKLIIIPNAPISIAKN